MFGWRAVKDFRKEGERVFGVDKYHEMDSLHSSCKTKVEPTFWEFIQFLIKHPTTDNHWKPFSQLCSVCSVRYSFIIHFERMEEEEKELLRKMGLLIRFPPLHMNSESHAKENLTQIYLRMLKKDDIDKLLMIYHQDIKIFGYEEQIERIMLVL